MVALHSMHPLRIPGPDDIASLEDFLGPVGEPEPFLCIIVADA